MHTNLIVPTHCNKTIVLLDLIIYMPVDGARGGVPITMLYLCYYCQLCWWEGYNRRCNVYLYIIK